MPVPPAANVKVLSFWQPCISEDTSVPLTVALSNFQELCTSRSVFVFGLLLPESLLHAVKRMIVDKKKGMNLRDFIKLNLFLKIPNVLFVRKVFKRDPLRALTS